MNNNNFNGSVNVNTDNGVIDDVVWTRYTCGDDTYVLGSFSRGVNSSIPRHSIDAIDYHDCMIAPEDTKVLNQGLSNYFASLGVEYDDRLANELGVGLMRMAVVTNPREIEADSSLHFDNELENLAAAIVGIRDAARETRGLFSNLTAKYLRFMFEWRLLRSPFDAKSSRPDTFMGCKQVLETIVKGLPFPYNFDASGGMTIKALNAHIINLTDLIGTYDDLLRSYWSIRKMIDVHDIPLVYIGDNMQFNHVIDDLIMISEKIYVGTSYFSKSSITACQLCAATQLREMRAWFTVYAQLLSVYSEYSKHRPYDASVISMKRHDGMSPLDVFTSALNQFLMSHEAFGDPWDYDVDSYSDLIDVIDGVRRQVADYNYGYHDFYKTADRTRFQIDKHDDDCRCLLCRDDMSSVD